MSKIGILSKHIVLTSYENTHPRSPISGIILIQNEIIQDVIFIPKEETIFSNLSVKYSE